MTDTLEVRTVYPQEAYNTLQGHNSSRLLSPEMIKVQEGRIGITCPNEFVAGLMRDKYGSLKNVTVKITPKEPTTHEKETLQNILLQEKIFLDVIILQIVHFGRKWQEEKFQIL
jgi:hypothetical protein